MGRSELIGTVAFCFLLVLPIGWKRNTTVGHPPHDLMHGPQVARDLAEIKHDTLRVLVLRDPLTYEERPGARTGLEWELLERFAQRRRLPITAIPVSSRDSMLLMLQTGQGDVIAAQLMAFGWAAPYVHLTRPYRHVAYTEASPRRFTAKPAEGSVGLTVSAWSPLLDSTGALAVTDTVRALRVVEQLPEPLLVATALGQYDRLLSTDATAAMEAKRLPLVEFGPRKGRSVPLVFAVRRNASHLQHALDTWLASAREVNARNALIAAYDNGLETRGPRRKFGAFVYGGDSISPFDSLFQVHADSLAWDWKLLAAVAYKESGFDTAAVSHAGAGGLMQMMPHTAAQMGVEQGSGIDAHIQGAAKYLARLDRIWQGEVPSPAQRLKFVLAAYNAGPGHVKDAQRLAVELGLDPYRWDGNVEYAMVLLNRPAYFTRPACKTGYCRGQHTFWYVRDVLNLFAWLRGSAQS